MSLKQTPLYEAYINTGCRMASFAGWEMPIQFSSLMNEHHAVREEVGVFDISHMGVFILKGRQAKDGLQKLVPSDLYRIGPGEACYTVLLNKDGGIIDDLIIYDLGHDNNNNENLIIVINAACIEQDIAWIDKYLSPLEIKISDFKKDGIFIALQGPKTIETLNKFLQESPSLIPRFGHKFINHKNTLETKSNPIFIARTGYTGEDGFELLVDQQLGKALWLELIKEGIQPCGLGARDTLRLEAALHLYGNEMNANTSPLEAGLGWLVHLEMPSDFIGRKALEKQTAKGIDQKLVGLEINGRGIARKGYQLLKDKEIIGEITSGSWSPTLKKAIAMGYVKKEFGQIGTEINVDIRGKEHKATVVRRPFYTNKNKL